MWSHILGLSSVARNAIRSRAVSLVCLRDDTKMRTGLVGEWTLIAEKQNKQKECSSFLFLSVNMKPLDGLWITKTTTICFIISAKQSRTNGLQISEYVAYFFVSMSLWKSKVNLFLKFHTALCIQLKSLSLIPFSPGSLAPSCMGQHCYPKIAKCRVAAMLEWCKLSHWRGFKEGCSQWPLASFD